MMRRMMGMPSAGEERKRAREAQRRQREAEREETRRRRSGERRHPAPRYRAAMLLQSVAVDVEFTEVREFSAYVSDYGDIRIVCEEQLSDAEFTEINFRKR